LVQQLVRDREALGVEHPVTPRVRIALRRRLQLSQAKRRVLAAVLFFCGVVGSYFAVKIGAALAAAFVARKVNEADPSGDSPWSRLRSFLQVKDERLTEPMLHGLFSPGEKIDAQSLVVATLFCVLLIAFMSIVGWAVIFSFSGIRAPRCQAFF
jgi:hypothetical protein